MGSRMGIADSKERMDLAPGDVLLTVMSLSSPKVPRRRCINLLLPTPPYWKFYRTLHSFCPRSALCTPAYTSGDVTYGEEDSPAERRESIVAASVLSRLASFRFPLKTFLLGNRLNANCPNNSLPVISWKFSTKELGGRKDPLDEERIYCNPCLPMFRIFRIQVETSLSFEIKRFLGFFAFGILISRQKNEHRPQKFYKFARVLRSRGVSWTFEKGGSIYIKFYKIHDVLWENSYPFYFSISSYFLLHPEIRRKQRYYVESAFD